MQSRGKLPAELARAGFRVSDATLLGLRPGRLRGRDLQRPFHGTRSVDADLSSHVARCKAYQTRLGPCEFYSHVSAAHLHSFPLPLGMDDGDIHTSVFEPERAPKLRGVVTHELKPTGQRVCLVDGMPTIGLEDTWAQLATLLPTRELVVIADHLLTGREPYSGVRAPSDREALDRAIGRQGRRRGVRSLREALDLARYGSLSPQETRLRLLLVQAGLPEPALNYRVFDDRGNLYGMVDLAYPESRIAFEYLGDHHRSDPGVYRDDIQRRERFADLRWMMFFVTAPDLIAPGRLLARTRAALASTGKRFE